jgi:DNA-binding LacI/PurR family transcriptional regulator
MEPFGSKKSTIGQVAAMAGVSTTTVSLYLRGNDRVCSEATSKRIDWAVSKLNYQPNPLAGAAYNKERRTVGLLAGDDLERGNTPWAVYNMRIVNGVLEVANEMDYSILTYPFRVFLEKKHRAILDGRVDGVLFYGKPTEEIIERLVDADMPVVSFGSPSSKGRVAGRVFLDEAAISRMALEHLWSLGHRRIAHLAGPYQDCYRLEFTEQTATPRLERAEPVSMERLNGCVAFLKEHRAYDPQLISSAHAWKHANALPTLERWWKLPNRPTAIYCANDYIAWEVVCWARSNGIEIPKDVAVVGVDNVEGPDRELFLTSIDIRVEEVGRQAMRLMLELLTGKPPDDRLRVVEPGSLVVRASTIGGLGSAKLGRPSGLNSNVSPLQPARLT